MWQRNGCVIHVVVDPGLANGEGQGRAPPPNFFSEEGAMSSPHKFFFDFDFESQFVEF